MFWNIFKIKPLPIINLQETIMETNSQSPLIDNSGKLVDLSVTRNDIIDYVVEKEKEKLTLLKKDANLILVEKQKAVSEFKKNKLVLISEKSKELNKVIIDAYLSSYPDAEVIVEDLNNLQHGNSYHEDIDMNMLYRFGGPMFEFMSRGMSQRRTSQGGYLIIISSSTNSKVVYGISQVQIPEDFLKDLQNKFNTLENEEKIAYKEVNNISSQIQELIHNRGKIKSKLVEQVLSNSDEGLKILESLKNISFADNKLKLD